MTRAIILLPLILLAACDSGPQVSATNASVAEVAAKVEAARLDSDFMRKPGPDFFTGNKSCRYDHFTMGDGKIDGRMRCTAGGGTQVSTMTGTYGPDVYRMAMTTAMENPSGSPAGGMDGLTMKLSVEGKRIGDCDAATPATKQETAP